MKMKIGHHVKVGIIVAAFGLVSCGVDAGKFADMQTSLESASEEALGDELALFSAEEAPEEVYEVDEASKETARAVVSKLKGLHKQSRLEMADCMGMSEQVEAFETQKEELIESGLTREEIKAELKESHLAMHKAMREKRDERNECRETLKEGETRVALRELLDACFNLPEKEDRVRGEGKKPQFLKSFGKKRGGKKGKKKGKRGKRGIKLPPKEFADFSSEACQAIIAE